jgi:hypothetical protein
VELTQNVNFEMIHDLLKQSPEDVRGEEVSVQKSAKGSSDDSRGGSGD